MPSCGVDPSWRSSTSSPTATFPALGTTSAGRTSKRSSMPASTSSRRSTSSTSSRSTTSSNGSPGSSNARRCPIGSSARPTRSSSSTWRPRRCAGGMAHGNIYAADKVDAALGNYFRPGNLSALRELALLWVADRVDDSLAEYRERHGITKPWETRERVVVALSGAPAGFQLIRRAARIAQRANGELHRSPRHRQLRPRLGPRRRRRRRRRRPAAAARGARRRVSPRDGQRRRHRPRRRGPRRERHPDRARRDEPLTVARDRQRLDHQPRRAPVRPDRRARHLRAPRRGIGVEIRRRRARRTAPPVDEAGPHPAVATPAALGVGDHPRRPARVDVAVRQRP